MSSYKFSFEDKEYVLSEDNFDTLINDEEFPVEGFQREDAINLLNQCSEVSFDLEYYEQPCFACKSGVKEKEKSFKFLEYHFYIFTKDSRYVISSISSGYENTSFNKLLKEKKVDNSYIVSIIVCKDCGYYSIEIEQCEV